MFTQCLVGEAEKPSLETIQVGRIPVKEGKNLPNSETEDVGGFSLHPTYSAKQLRRIQRLRIRGCEKNGTHDLMTTLRAGCRLQW